MVEWSKLPIMDTRETNENQDIIETKEREGGSESDRIKTDESADTREEEILSDKELGSISNLSHSSCSDTEHVEEKDKNTSIGENDDSEFNSEFDSTDFDFDSIGYESEVENNEQVETVDIIVNFFRVRRPQRFIGQVSH